MTSIILSLEIKLAIARALIMEPQYLFADEPTGDGRHHGYS